MEIYLNLKFAEFRRIEKLIAVVISESGIL